MQKIKTNKILKLRCLILAVLTSMMLSSLYAQDLTPFESEENGKWGYKNNDSIVIEPQYDEAEPFEEGIAVIGIRRNLYDGDKVCDYGMIDKNGTIVIEVKHEWFIYYHNGYFILEHEILDMNKNRIKVFGSGPLAGKDYFPNWYLSYVKGSEIVQFTKIEDCDERCSKPYLVQLNGKIIGKLKFDNLNDFHDGLGMVYNDAPAFYTKSGYIDTTGKTVIKAKFYDARDFSDSMAFVALNEKRDKIGFIDIHGNVVIRIDPHQRAKNEFHLGVSDFHNGLAFIITNDFVGFINKKGDRVHTFSNDWYSYSKGIDERASGVWLGEGKWLGDGKGEIQYCYNGGGKYVCHNKVVVDDKGKALYFLNEEEEKVDKNGNPIETPKKQKPSIEWFNIPSTTPEPQFALKAQIKSDSKIDFCKLYLNGNEVPITPAPSGSEVVLDKDDHNMTINETLTLAEGTNTIKIKAANQGGVTEESRTIQYTKPVVGAERALIVWSETPSTTKSPDFTVNAEIKSTSKNISYQVLLNGTEQTYGTKGSYVVPDEKKDGEYSYSAPVNRTLTLMEGNNSIQIIVKGSKGETLTSKQQDITYVKPQLATITWKDVPSSPVTEKLFTMRAEIKSQSEVEYYRILKKGVEVKKVFPPKTKGLGVVHDRSNSIVETIILDEGDNKIEIEVKNEVGTIVSSRVVNYKHVEKRIALVIGNANYQDIHFPKLRKTKEDAKAMYALLGFYGFDMRPIVLDADKQTMRNAINDFVDEVGKESYEVALIYYSGHGLSPDGGANYLIPIDARIEYSDEVKSNAINSKTELISRLEEKNCRVEIILLDCCNDCALAERGTKGAYDGHLTPVYPKSHGISIIHAALPGKKAIEGDGKNSPFVESFIECTKSHPNVDWESFINDFIYDVQIRTGNYQTPYPEGRIIGKPFYINPQN